jgi:uncharacterized protein YodC (DUF2158 family)
MKKVAKKRIVEKRTPQTCAEATNRRSKFKLGDVVMLVTGSFPMVVAGIEKGAMVRLVWCHGDRGWLDHYSLPEAGLMRAPRPAPVKRAKLIPVDEIPF